MTSSDKRWQKLPVSQASLVLLVLALVSWGVLVLIVRLAVNSPLLSQATPTGTLGTHQAVAVMGETLVYQHRATWAAH